MGDEKYRGDNHEGEGRSAPYGLSRLAPVTTLVDVAREIDQADALIAQTTSSKLKLIAEQIQRLQADAREILAAAKQDLELHRATCSFSRRVGQTYHLYEKADGSLYWSMLSPAEWTPRHAPRGSFRLELDQSWTEVRDGDEPTPDDPLAASVVIRELLAPK